MEGYCDALVGRGIDRGWMDTQLHFIGEQKGATFDPYEITITGKGTPNYGDKAYGS